MLAIYDKYYIYSKNKTVFLDFEVQTDLTSQIMSKEQNGKIVEVEVTDDSSENENEA